jgi:zinc protease
VKYLWFVLLFFSATADLHAQGLSPTKAILGDGVRVVCKQEPTSNLVAITVFIQAGSAEENLQDAGIGSMVADALLSGTSNENSDTMATSIGAIGGNVKAIWEPDFTQIRALVLPSQFADASYLLSDVLKNADFAGDSVENARQDLLSRIQERTDDVFDSTNDRLRTLLYSGTPYSLPQIGTTQTVNKLTRTDVVNYFERYYRPDNILISVVGNVSDSTVVNTFNGDLSDFVRPKTRHVAPLVVPSPTKDTQPVVVKSYRSDVTAGLMMAGYTAPGVGTADYPVMIVANALLGGMKTSFMFKNLRTKKMFGYEVASNYTTQIGMSDVTGYILYSPTANGGLSSAGTDETAAVKQALLDQFKLLAAAPPSDAELVRAKKYVIGSYLLAHERIEDRSYYLGYSELACKGLGGYKFDRNYADLINAVTAEDVVQVAKKYFSDAPVVSILLPGNPDLGVHAD